MLCSTQACAGGLIPCESQTVRLVALLDTHLQARLPIAHTAEALTIIPCLSEECPQIPLPSSDREENPDGAESTEEREDGAR